MKAVMKLAASCRIPFSTESKHNDHGFVFLSVLLLTIFLTGAMLHFSTVHLAAKKAFMSEERMIYLDQLLHYGAAYTVHLIQKEQTEEQRWPEESWKETMTFDEGTITSTIEPDASELLQVTIKAEGHHEEWARAHFSYDIELEKVIEWRAY